MKKSKQKKRVQTRARVAIVWFSPSGSTRKVAEAYRKVLGGAGASVQMLPLERSQAFFEQGDAAAFWQQLEPFDLLLVGGPIYIDHMQYNLTDLLYEAPFAGKKGAGSYAAVFSTFGKVEPGVGLAEAARILSRKGYSVISGLEVDAVHSATRLLPEPVSGGLPGKELDAWIKTSVESMLATLGKRKKGSLDLVLSQRFQEVPDLRSEQEVLALYPEVAFDENLCTGCGKCVRVCPTLDLSLVEEIPVHREDSRCIHCTNCLVACPAGAVLLPLTKRSDFVLAKLKQKKLEPSGPSRTQLYLLD